MMTNFQHIKEVELIDEVGFIQALTLIAITHESGAFKCEDYEFEDDEANARIDDDEDEVDKF